MYAVTESVNTQQHNIGYDDKDLYLIPRSRFYERGVILQSITYKV